MQRFKIWISQILIILIFFRLSSLLCKDSHQLRIFTELNGIGIKKISIIDSTTAVAISNKELFKWTGGKWQKFYPQFPEDKIYPNYFKAFSLTNIWIFTQKHEYSYKTQIYHFDGDKWEKIYCPCPYTLSTVGFIDSTKFFAAGDWGNVVYFNGKRAINIFSPKSRYSRIVHVFDSSHFYLGVWKYDYFNSDEIHIYEYNNGNWNFMGKVIGEIRDTRFFSPDSGYIITWEKYIYVFRDNRFILCDSLPKSSSLVFKIYKDCKIYYLYNKILWEYDVTCGKKKSIAEIGFQCEPYRLARGEYFLIADKSLYYLGRRDYGSQLQKLNKRFISKELSKSRGIDFSVSSYRNRDGNIDLYFTDIYRTNKFYRIDIIEENIRLNDIIIRRGLIGYERTEVPLGKMDSGVFFADFDNDGDMDAICTAFRGNSLIYENCGNDRFFDLTEELDFRLNERIETISLGDLNRDGLIDFVAGDYMGSLHIFINKDFSRFEDIAKKAGIPDTVSGFSTVMADVDNDLDLDLFLFRVGSQIQYFENMTIQDSTELPRFVYASNKSPQLTVPFDFFTQCMAFGDYDNDQDLDLFLANRVTPIKLFQNDGHGIFTDISEQVGLTQSMIAYSANWGDLDQDGDLDIFVATLGKNYIFWNQNGEFFDIDSVCLLDNQFTYSTGSILEDLDQDGDLDIVVANLEIGASEIYINTLNKNNYIKVRLIGTQSNYYGIGSHVSLYKSGHLGDPEFLVGYRQITSNSGYSCSCLPEAYFGVSYDENYDLLVEFPSGQRIKKFNLKAGNNYIIHEETTFAYSLTKKLSKLKLFYYRKRYRYIILRFILFLFILFLFNIYIKLRTYWPKYRKLFYFTILFSSYIISSLLINSRQIDFKWFLPIYITLIVGVIIFLLIQRYTVVQYKKEYLYEMYDLLRQFRHSRDGMKQIDHLLFYLNNISNIKSDQNLSEDFNKELNNLYLFTIPIIHRIIDKGRLMELPISNIQRIERNINRLKKSRSTLISFPYKQSYVKNSLLLINNLKNEIMIIQKEIEKYFVCNPFKVLNDSLGKFPQFSRISISNPIVKRYLKVVILPEELDQVFTNLFENSLEAMEHKEYKHISISIELLAVGQLTIKIQDFGKGIPRSQQSLVFEESFSTKGSSGLGLFYSRKILSRYGGDLKLVKSTPGKGTTFQITLRVIES